MPRAVIDPAPAAAARGCGKFERGGSMFLLSLLGLLLLILTMSDLAVTTLTSRGAGPVTLRVTERAWRLLLKLHRRRPRHGLLAMAGMVMIALLAALWVAGLWTGWSLIFIGAETPLVNASTEEPADTVERIYFVGYTLFTLGLGDFRPHGDPWRILTVLCVGNGLIGMTLAVTYLVPIVSAATQKRQLALSIATLGEEPEDILRNSWNGERFDLDEPLSEITSMILGQGQQHLAYPALHYFHSPERASSLSLRIAALSEALVILAEHVSPEHRPKDLALRRCSMAISSFLAALDQMFIDAAADPPPPPEVSGLTSSGLPVSDVPLAGQEALALRDERRKLKTFVEADGWTWDDLTRRESARR